MTAIFELIAEMRKDVKKGASRRLRRMGLVPAIVYGADKEPMCIKISHNLILQALQHEAFYSHILTLNVDNKKESVVLKAVQRHPYRQQILHIDFLRIKANEKLTMNIPIHLLGAEDAPGVKDGGTVLRYLKEVEIECFPADLPEFIEVDLSNVELNQTIHLSDLTLPPKVELTADIEDEEQNEPIVSIQMIHIKEEKEVAPVETEILTAKAEEKPAGEEAKE